MDYLKGANILWTNFRHISGYILAPRWWCIWPRSARSGGGGGSLLGAAAASPKLPPNLMFILINSVDLMQG